MTNLFDRNGNVVILGREIGSGGEGTVFSLAHNQRLAAKVYHQSASADDAQKLYAMVQLGNADLTAFTAWPISTLHSSQSSPPIGFAMPYAHGYKALHKLTAPKSRHVEFNGADWRFLIHTAANLARATHLIHRNGHVIGDINHNNILVSDQAMVMLIDCDSFQVCANSRVFPCNVGVLTHQPPELQQVGTFRDLRRTPNHDCFGLAVSIFQLLFMGRHPFSGKYLGSGDSGALETAIAEYRFAYGADARTRLMEPPPGALTLDALPNEVALMFSQAFGRSGSRDGGRPTAEQWVQRLDALSGQVISCGRNGSHYFVKGTRACPWCAIEAQTGIALFAVVVVQTRSPDGVAFDLNAVWAGILGVRSPGSPPLPATPHPNVTAKPTYSEIGLKQRKRLRLAVAAAIVLWLALVPVIVLHRMIVAAFLPSIFVALAVGEGSAWGVWFGAVKEHRASKRSLQVAAEQWVRRTGEQDYQRIMRELESARDQYQQLTLEREKRIQELQTNARQRQLLLHLQRHRVYTSTIKGVGPMKKAGLQSYGIENAADVSYQQVIQVPGFGPALTQTMVQWRMAIEHSFVFDVARALDPRDVQDIDGEIQRRKVGVESILRGGAGRLRLATDEALKTRNVLAQELHDASVRMAQSRANIRAMRPF